MILVSFHSKCFFLFLRTVNCKKLTNNEFRYKEIHHYYYCSLYVSFINLFPEHLFPKFAERRPGYGHTRFVSLVYLRTNSNIKNYLWFGWGKERKIISNADKFMHANLLSDSLFYVWHSGVLCRIFLKHLSIPVWFISDIGILRSHHLTNGRSLWKVSITANKHNRQMHYICKAAVPICRPLPPIPPKLDLLFNLPSEIGK